MKKICLIRGISRLKKSIYVFENEGKKLWMKFYNDEIVRFFYGDEIEKSITDAVILKPKSVAVEKKGNFIKGSKFDVEITEDLLVKIYDKSGDIILEDLAVEFSVTKLQKKKVNDLENIEDTLASKEKKKVFAVEVEKKLDWEKGFYGLGEKYGHINLMDRYTENWNTDVLGASPIHHSAQNAYHTSIPFYIGMDEKKAYGLYYDNSHRTFFDFKKYSENVRFMADGGALDYYFIYGENVAEVVENYSKLTGTVKLPRKDFLGYQQCRWSYMDTEEVLDIAKKLRDNDIPSDVIYLDIDYMQDYKVFTIDSKRFKAFKEMTEELHEMGFKLVVIIDPGVKVEKGYEVYDQGIEKDYFIKDENGEVYVGKVWPGDSTFPDYLRKEVREWWGELHRGLINLGVDGIWNDMNEIADMSTETKTVPETTYQIDENGEKRTQKEVHNLYGHYEAIATYEGLKKIQKTRPFVLTRAASAGTQRYSVLWTGDNSSVWEHLEGSISMLLNLGLSGYSYIGSDIGGFIEDGSGELLARWTQLGVFYPFCRNHSVINSIHQEPWAFGSEVLDITRKYIKLRYSLISHLYNLFRESSIKGTPIMRPLFYHYQNDPKTFNITDQFLFGEDILVAPITRSKTETRMIYLPVGDWYDYFTGEKYEGGNYIIREAKLDELPIFVREGGIILKNKEMKYIGEKEEKYEIHIYPGKNNEKEFYFDDGMTFNYERDEYSVITMKLKDDKFEMKGIKDGFEVGEIDLVIHRGEEVEVIKNISIDKIYSI